MNVNSTRIAQFGYGTILTNYGTINWISNQFSIYTAPGRAVGHLQRTGRVI